MSETTTKISDSYTQKREEQRQILQKCQKEQNLSSCLLCPKLVGCQTRRSYVQAVYESMSKGNSGDFEF